MSAVVQASDRRQSQIQAHKQLCVCVRGVGEEWLLVPFLVAAQSSQVYTLQWTLLTRIRPAVRKCTAEGASRKCAYSSGGELQESRLASCTHAATEACTGCQCGSGYWSRRESREGIGHQSAANTCGVKVVKSAGPLWHLC